MKKYFMRFFDEENDCFVYSKLLKMLCIILSVTIFISQTGLIIDETRDYFTAVDILDGSMKVSSGNIINKGEIVLMLDKGKPSEDISILVNGDEYSKFEDKSMVVTIKNQSVIEIVNETKNKIEVSIASISDNLTYTYKAKDTSIENISLICRVIFR